jgi:tetratricopeptide (TPR) repeat protein
VQELDEIYETAIGPALALGDRPDFIEACRHYLSQNEVQQDEFPLFFCRLGEALFHRGERDRAIVCAQAAFELQPEHEDVAHICAWIFSNCGRHQEAAAAYARLLEIRPLWAEGHRHLSGSLSAAGQLDRAIFHAGTASGLDPHSIEFALHAASICETAGRHGDALDYLARAANLAPEAAGVLRQMSNVKLALGAFNEAVSLALRALSLEPEDRRSALHASELLLRTGRLDEAAELVQRFLGDHPTDAVALRQLSSAQMLRGMFAAALDAIDRALIAAPHTAEYHLHRANLLYRLGRLGEAAEAFDQAATLDPGNPETKRGQLTVYFDSGRLTEALAVGGELIRTAPDNKEYARAVLHVLHHRLDTLEVTMSFSASAHSTHRENRALFLGSRHAAHSRTGHLCADYTRDSHPVRRFKARIWVGATRAGRSYPDALAGICGDDAGTAAARR